MADPLIFNIQRFSLHDGPGIRSTVFFKGCPLRCPWCHNPEGQSFEAERVFHPERCIGCGRCHLGCASGARERIGRAYDVEVLVQLLQRDRQAYEASDGGVTLSGGEVLAQDLDYLLAITQKLKRRGVHVAADTSGYAPWEVLDALRPHVDLWLYDLKALTPALHRRHTGVDNAPILSNLKRLSDAGARVWLRVPVVPSFNADDAEMGAMAAFARANVRAEQVNLLPYHRLGQDKRPEPAHFDVPTSARMAEIEAIWRQAGFDRVKIGG